MAEKAIEGHNRLHGEFAVPNILKIDDEEYEASVSGSLYTYI